MVLPLLFNNTALESDRGSYGPSYAGLQRTAGGSSKELSSNEMSDQISIINFLATTIIAGIVWFFSALATQMSQRTVTMGANKPSDEKPKTSAKDITGVNEELDTSCDYITGVNEAVKNRIKEVNGKSAEEIRAVLGIQESIDLGGHGGTFRGCIKVDGKPHFLFLKPKDNVEYRNYQIIQRLAPEVAEFMPKVYGEIRIGEKSYLVMENTRISQTGESLEQLVDIKLAGKVSGDPNFNPIASQDEMKATRGEEKNKFDYRYMQFYSTKLNEKGFVITEGEKYERILNYSKSTENLLRSLEDVSIDKLENLIKDMRKLKEAMEQCPVSFIGASIILVKDEMGNIKPILIDPAHIEVLSFEEERLPVGLRKNTYFSDSGKYRVSNSIAMGDIIDVITDMKKEKETLPQEILSEAYHHLSEFKL